MRADLQARFWSKVVRTETCWLWLGSAGDKSGHGALGVRLERKGPQRPVYAHRFSYVLHRGPIPDGLQVNHHCDVANCVNPDHLYLGTQLDNMRDASRRGRLAKVRRPRKLSADEVVAIRALAQDGGRGLQNRLAEAYGVSKAAISQIVTGKRRVLLDHAKQVIAQERVS